jgi:hypothetical protein
MCIFVDKLNIFRAVVGWGHVRLSPSIHDICLYDDLGRFVLDIYTYISND